MGDLASGTSSRLGKVFHGGLRYLRQLNFSLVRQASRERNLMVERLCPHLTRPTPFLFPLSRPLLDRLTVGAGVWLYDLLEAGARRHERAPAPQRSRSAPRGAWRSGPSGCAARWSSATWSSTMLATP